MSNNIYSILGKLNSLTPKQEEQKPAAQPVYESVEAKGSILEGVKKVQSRLEAKLAEHKGGYDPERMKDGDMAPGGAGAGDISKEVEEERETLKTKTGTIYKGGKYGNADYESDDEESDKPKKRGRPAKGSAPKAKKEPGQRGRPKKEKPASFDAPKGDIFGRTSGAVPKGKKGTMVKGKAMSHEVNKKDDVEEAAKNPYAIGMAQAMKSTGDKPPLKKSTINKAHSIAKKVKTNEGASKLAQRFLSEGINFRKMAEETGATVDEMLGGLQSDINEYKQTGICSERLRDFLELHNAGKRQLADATRPEMVPAVQRKEQGKDFPVTLDQVHDTSDKISHRDTLAQNTGREIAQDLDELARLAGIKMSESKADKKADKDYDGDGKIESGKDEYLGSKIAAAKKAGKLEEGEMCKSCKCDPCECDEDEEEVNEAAKPDFLDVDKDGNKKETFKKAVKDKEDKQVDECMSPIGSAAGAMEDSQGHMSVNTSADSDGHKTVTITADGDEADKLAELLRLSGLGSGTARTQQEPEVKIAVVGDAEEEVDEEREVDQVQAPHEEYATVDSITQQGADLNRPKQQFKHGYKQGDNPMAVKESEDLLQLSRSLMQTYESIKLTK